MSERRLYPPTLEGVARAGVAYMEAYNEIDYVATELLTEHGQSMTDLLWLRDQCGGHLPTLRDVLVKVLAEIEAGGDPIKELRETAERVGGA